MKPSLILAALAAALTACSSPAPSLLTAHTNQVATVQAVQVPQPVQTVTRSPAGDTQTNWVTNLVTVFQTNTTAVVTYTPSATTSNVLSTLSAANAITAPADPFAPILAALIALASATVGAYATHKTSSAAVQCHSQMVATVVDAVKPTPPPKS